MFLREKYTMYFIIYCTHNLSICISDLMHLCIENIQNILYDHFGIFVAHANLILSSIFCETKQYNIDTIFYNIEMLPTVNI